METKTITDKKANPENNRVQAFPVVVLVLLILTFVGLQAYYMISSMMTP